MKKLLTAAVIIGLAAVPSLAFATTNHRVEDAHTMTPNVKQEDHSVNLLANHQAGVEDHQAEDRAALPAVPATPSHVDNDNDADEDNAGAVNELNDTDVNDDTSHATPASAGAANSNQARGSDNSGSLHSGRSED